MKSILSIIIVLLFFSCQNKSNSKFEEIEKMNWLIGNWENKQENGVLVENWKKENDSTITGKSYFINTKDTVHFETIKLSQKADNIIYSTEIIGQNSDNVIEFNLKSSIENTFTFQNLTNDYPKMITYKKLGNTNFIISISGKEHGKTATESYSMTKK